MIQTIDEFIQTAICSGTLEKIRGASTKFENMINSLIDENTDWCHVNTENLVLEMIDQGCFENTIYEKEGDDIVVITICENE